MRLRTLPLASASVIFGSSLAMNRLQIDWSLFGWTLATAICLQILSNLANDYGDYTKGTDDEGRIGPARALQSGAITKRKMLTGILLTSVISLGSGLYTLYLAFGSLTHSWSLSLLAIGILSIAAAINYTIGKRAYGYSGLGDLAVFIFFGIVGVGGTYVLQVKSLYWDIAFPTVAIGLLSVAVLNLNNLRDIENDRKHGKRTIPVKIGLENGKSYHATLILAAWMCLTIWWIKSFQMRFEIVFFLPAIIFTKHLKKALRTEDPKSYDPELKKVVLATFALAVTALGLALTRELFFP